MQKFAFVAKFAIASLIVWALLMLLCRARIFKFLWVSVHACFFLFTVASFLVKLADRYHILPIKVHVLARVSLSADVLEPVDAYFSLDF